MMLRLVGCAVAAAGVSGEAPPGAPRRAVQPESASSAFVHLFEWSWADVAAECEQWLGPKGFTAVQISPPNEHIQGPAWWTRYQPVTYKLQSRSGDEAAFADMVSRCNKVGVGIYADAVLNHIAAGSGTGVAGSSFGNRATPIYSQNDMHHNSGDPSHNCAVQNYRDKHEVQYCDLVGLPDLCTSCEYVQKTAAAYVDHMLDLGIAGYRLDAAKHMDAGELGGLLAKVKGEALRFQEVISGSGEAVTPNMYFSNGLVTEFNYGRQLASNFLNDGKLQYLGNFGESWGFIPRQHAVVFIDNHDTQRSDPALTYKNGKLYELATVFMLAHPYGFPKIMSSYYFNSKDQGPPGSPVHSGTNIACGSSPLDLGTLNSTERAGGPWVCEHRWTAVANMVAWRRAAGAAEVGKFQAPGGDTIAFCRGASACIALNRQESATWSTSLKFSVPAGKYCNVIQSDDVSSCPTVEVGGDGSVHVDVPPLGSVAVHIGKRVEGGIMWT